MKIAMCYMNNPAFGIDTHDRIGLGGSENGFIRTVQKLIELGHSVHVYNQTEGHTDYGERLKWSNLAMFRPKDPWDVVYSLRHWELFRDNDMPNTGLRVLFLADTESIGLGDQFRQNRLDLVMSVSNWQKEKIAREENIPDDYWCISSNGLVRQDVELDLQKVPGRCLFTATPDRGLGDLLALWPEIKNTAKHASLHLYSSFLGWRMSAEENESRLASLYKQAEDMSSLDVVNHRHGTFDQLQEARRQAEFYLYPTNFSETRCMSVLEALYQGVIPIVTAKAGLMEMVVNEVTGFTVPAYGTGSSRYRNAFVASTLEALLANKQKLDYIRANGVRYARQFTYDNLVPTWLNEWRSRLSAKGHHVS